MTKTALRPGDFNALADDYSRFRPGYSPSVLDALLGLFPTRAIDVADVGAGTGIWTRMMASAGVRSVTAVEPSEEMRRCGVRDSGDLPIQWRAGSGEATGLAESSADLLSMASSFHWVDTQRGLAEFARVLRPGGRFVALWNPRRITGNPLLEDIEAQLVRLKPDLKRVSSGRSGITERLSDILRTAPDYEDVLYLEGEHTVTLSREHYLGAWRSVNDIQAQLGPQLFQAFLDYVAERIADVAVVESVYTTRAWTARRRKEGR